jgi:hypothetical protein
MKRFFFAALAACSFVFSAHAQSGQSSPSSQSSESGPFMTPGGTMQFVRDDRDFVALFDNRIFDRFDAKTVVHYDDVSGAGGKLQRMLVQTDSGPVLYDFRRSPPLVQRIGKRMVVKRVFWQGEEVVMQGDSGWYGFQRGALTKLQSSTSVYR